MRTVFDKAVLRVAVAALALAVGAMRVSAQAPPPDAAWRTLETEHFRVTFPERLQGLGREAAARAERAWTELAAELGHPPGGRTEILLTDHIDASNGFASVAPYRRITVYARPPLDGLALSHYDDWLEVVITHELAHVFHLDVAGPLGRALRTVFGRVPVTWPFFPELGVPGWVPEGLATWYESDLTGAGRVRGTYHAMVLRTATLEDRFEAIDQASGDSPVWPAGERPYVYGSLFFDDLLARYGPERMGVFVEAVGDQVVPYRLNAASRKAFGISFSEAWRRWREALERDLEAERARRSALAPLTRPVRLTRGARQAFHPRVSPDGRTLVFARANGHDDTQLRRATPDGEASEELVRTNGLSTFDFAPDGGLVFAQLEFDDPYRLWSDLWTADADGGTRRLTRGARLDQPSVAPDGRTAVAVQIGQGTSRLVTVDLTTGEVRPLTDFDPDVHWAFPAASPDGRWIAAARWEPGAYFDVVVLDRDGGPATPVTRDRALDTAPAWSPDGRWIVWSSDRSGIANLMGVAFDPASGTVGEVRQVTNLLTGAQYPSVDPSGRWIHYSGYHADGWEVEEVPFEPDAWFEPFPLAARFRAEPSVAGDGPADDGTVEVRDTPIEPYSSLPTFPPRYWEPAFSESVQAHQREVLGSSFGFRTASEDLVGRHRLDLELLFSTTAGRPSGTVAYEWAGLGNPVLGFSASQAWDAAGPYTGTHEDGTEVPLYVRERNQALSASATLFRARFRRASSLTFSGGLVWEDRTLLDAQLEPSTDFRLRRPAARLASYGVTGAFSTARAHAFSLGTAEGVTASLTARGRRELDLADSLASVPGSDRSYQEVLGRVRAFDDFHGPGYADHVLALRLSGGAARGPAADAFHFDVGGNPGEREAITGFGLVGGRSYFFPARGYLNGERSGRWAWSASLEYRFPLALVNRGAGLLPVHLDRVSGDLFLDAANAWGSTPGAAGGANPRDTPLSSVGGEVIGEFLALFSVPVTVRTGLAVRLDRVGGVEWYLRLGRAF